MLKIITLLLITVISLFLISCGSDSTSPIVPNPVVNDTIYTLPILEAAVNGGLTGSNFNSTSFGNSVTAANVRLEFTIQSNSDSSLGCIASYRDSSNGLPAPPSPLTVNVYSPVDSSYTVNLNLPAQYFYISFNVRMVVTNSQNTLRRYIRFVNVRVIKVS